MKRKPGIKAKNYPHILKNNKVSGIWESGKIMEGT